MSVYKITCESGKVYYGSTNNDIETRKSKGWYNCACKDFINPKIELIESVDDESKLYERELYYIRNFECINISGKGFNRNDWYVKNKERVTEYRKKSEDKRKVWDKFECEICGRMTNKKHYARHCKSEFHISKGKTPLKGPNQPTDTSQTNN